VGLTARGNSVMGMHCNGKTVLENPVRETAEKHAQSA